MTALAFDLFGAAPDSTPNDGAASSPASPHFARRAHRQSPPSYTLDYQTGETAVELTTTYDVVLQLHVSHKKASRNAWSGTDEAGGCWIDVNVLRLNGNLQMQAFGDDAAECGLRGFALPMPRYHAKQIEAVVAWLEAQRDTLVMPVLTQWRTNHAAARVAYTTLLDAVPAAFPPAVRR